MQVRQMVRQFVKTVSVYPLYTMGNDPASTETAIFRIS